MAVDKKEKIIVGVNDFVSEEKTLDVLQIDETVAHRQAERLSKLRADRSQAEVTRRLNSLRNAAKGKDNLMPFIYEAVKSYATLGDKGMTDVTVLVGGIIPEADIAALKQSGIAEIFLPGTSTQDIVEFIHKRFALP